MCCSGNTIVFSFELGLALPVIYVSLGVVHNLKQDFIV